MALTKRWAGRVFGTNTGNVFVKLEGEDDALTGVLRINEPGVVAVYAVQGAFEAPTLTLTGQSQTEIEGVVLGDMTAVGTLNASGDIRGDWETTIGTGGTFHLFPHNHEEEPHDEAQPDQHHVARHNFGAMQIDRDDIVHIAESIRADFPSVIVAVNTGTEQARYLDDFKEAEFSADKADLVRIFAQKQDASGANQSVTIEFGQQVNWALTQGANEAWVLGKLETLKRTLKRYERTYVTTYARWGISLNQLLLLAALVLLPSFDTLQDRAIFMCTGLALLLAINWLHSRYLPYAAIHLRERDKGLLGKFGPSVLSWIMGIIGVLLTTVVGAYLLGALELDDRPDETPAIEAPAE
ncbi:MAG: hypothetical protein ACFBQW_04860 [Sphingomonadaceae bacterium]